MTVTVEAENLASRQRRLFAAITEDDDAVAPAAELIRAGGSLDGAARLAIYRRMYACRLRDAIAEDYPIACVLLAEAELAAAMAGYSRAHPPDSYSLDHFTWRFADYLATVRGGLDVIVDVARVEGAIAMASIAPDAPHLTPADLATLDAGARLSLAPSVHLIAAQYPVCALFDAHRDGRTLTAPAPAPECVLVWRKDFVVWRKAVPRPAFALLEALAAGATLADALAATEATWPGPPSDLDGQVFSWFESWVAEGLFSGFDHPAEDCQ